MEGGLVKQPRGKLFASELGEVPTAWVPGCGPA